MSMLLDKTIRLFLDSIGKREEYEFYLERFKLGGQAAFAVIVPSHEGFAESAAVFVFDLRFLLRLGLQPVVLLCGTHAGQMAQLMEVEDAPFVFIRMVLRDAMFSADDVQELMASGKIPVLVDASISMEAGLPLLVPACTRRVHFIRASGPLHRADGTPLLHYQVKDPAALVPQDEALARFAGDLAERNEGLHISVASPLNLLSELFTVKGAGCLVRRGIRIERYASLATLDRERLIHLLENSFGRTLDRPACLDSVSCVYLDDDYRCAAILVPYKKHMYLSKFAVQREARGEGIAQELWRTITNDHASLFWRSRLRNPFNQWYDRQADGLHTENHWRVYWRGMARNDIPDVIASALARPLDFAPDQDGA
ncbi:MAG: hypothetical protein ACNA71_05230 [Kiritimatiellia bacterium]